MPEDLPPPAAPSTVSQLCRAALALVLCVLAAGLYFHGDRLSWEELKAQRDTLRGFTEARPVLSAAIFFLTYALVTSFALPIGPPLSVTAGALFDRVLGTLLVSCASTSGAAAAFLLSRYLFRDAVERRWGPRLEVVQRGVERDGAYYLLALRLSPLVPFTLINLAMGLTRMRLWTFWWVSQLGMLPITLLFVSAGVELGQMQSPRDALSPHLILLLSLAAVVPLAAQRIKYFR